jgi:hypothetical protein
MSARTKIRNEAEAIWLEASGSLDPPYCYFNYADCVLKNETVTNSQQKHY